MLNRQRNTVKDLRLHLVHSWLRIKVAHVCPWLQLLVLDSYFMLLLSAQYTTRLREWDIWKMGQCLWACGPMGPFLVRWTSILRLFEVHFYPSCGCCFCRSLNISSRVWFCLHHHSKTECGATATLHSVEDLQGPNHCWLLLRMWRKLGARLLLHHFFHLLDSLLHLLKLYLFGHHFSLVFFHLSDTFSQFFDFRSGNTSVRHWNCGCYRLQWGFICSIYSLLPKKITYECKSSVRLATFRREKQCEHTEPSQRAARLRLSTHWARILGASGFTLTRWQIWLWKWGSWLILMYPMYPPFFSFGWGQWQEWQ